MSFLFFFFTKMEKRRVGLVPESVERILEEIAECRRVKGEYGTNIVHTCIQMEKMRLGETIPEMGTRGDKGE
jgi:hypothetical protein